MPATRPRASFEPIQPDFDLKALVESTPNFSYVDRISCDMIDQQGMPAFEKLVLLHVIIGGKPLVIDGFEERLEAWTFTPQWLRDNCGAKQENARNLTSKESLPLTVAHYLKNMGMLTNQFFSKPGAYRDGKRQRVYLKDIDCPTVWQDKLREHIPSMLYYLNESTGDIGGPGAVPDPNSNASGRRLGKGVARAGDLMSSLPADMRAENLMCYVGHEGTYTPAHREMCASLGHNVMVEASNRVSSDDGKPEKPGSSIWFMTESKDRHTVSEYWLSVLGHDIEVENHFAQVVAWKKAPFNVYVVEQRPGDFILIPPLAPHQVWNRGTRTMKVAWNRTTVETLEMALNEALPRSRIVCRDEQYKNKAIIYYTLQKYSSLLSLAQSQASRLAPSDAQQPTGSPKIRQLAKDFRRLFTLYRQILISEMFNPEETPKGIEYLPFDGNVTCAYCRGNIFDRFLSCPSCKDLLGHHTEDSEGDPYDVCLDCYTMGRSCACTSNLKWVEQFRWKELAAKYESWRRLIIALDGGRVTDKTPLTIPEEKKRFGKKTLAEVCKEQLKRRPWKDVRKGPAEPKSDEEEDEEIIVDDNGTVKKIHKKKSKAWLRNNSPCHVCCHRHPNWKMAQCTTCERWWCYGTLFRGWDKMPIEIMQDPDWSCPHCLGICFAGACKREGKMAPYEPKGTLLGHDTRKVADARSVEALVDFSVSNLNWLKEDDPTNRAKSRRLERVGEEARKAKALDPSLEADEEADDRDGVEESRVEFEDASPTPPIDPAIGGAGATSHGDDDDSFAWRLQQANSSLPPPDAVMAGPPAGNGAAPDGYAPVGHAGYVPPPANMYPQPGENEVYSYPGGYDAGGLRSPVDDEEVGGLRPFKRRRTHVEKEDVEYGEDGISMTKHPKAKKPRMSVAGFQSSDLATTDAPSNASRHKTEAQRQFEKEKERKALEKAKAEGRFIMLQAALKGKRRIVRLSIPPQRLAQIMAQQAAKAALHESEEADAEHEVEEGAGAQLEGELEEEADAVLLKSDIVPKKTQNLKQYYQQRQKEGYVLSGASKKAMVPVEKDANYGNRDPRVRNKEALGQKKKQARKNAGTVDYEEVDIGSDNDLDDSTLFEPQPAADIRPAKERRSLPGYLQTRYADDTNLPDELPTRQPKPRKPRPARQSTPNSAPPKTKPMAGKRPSMRLAASAGMFDGAADDDESATQHAIEAAANGDFIDVDEVMAQPAPSFAAVNKPASRPSSGSNTKNQGSVSANQKQRNMDEQNRLAKLQALEMVDGNGGTSASAARKAGKAKANQGVVSMAQALEIDSDDEDGIEEVPATRAVKA